MIEPLAPEYRAKLRAALAGAGIYLDPDGLERAGKSVRLMRGPRPIAKMSAEAFGLLHDEAARLGERGARAVYEVDAPPLDLTKPDPGAAPLRLLPRCPGCGGRPYAHKAVGGHLCTSTFHRAPSAPETP